MFRDIQGAEWASDSTQCVFFFGIDRKSSIGNSPKIMCKSEGYGLEGEEIDILRKGQRHDLIDKETQERFMSDIESGFYDIQILSPPCGRWSWANVADDKPPYAQSAYRVFIVHTLHAHTLCAGARVHDTHDTHTHTSARRPHVCALSHVSLAIRAHGQSLTLEAMCEACPRPAYVKGMMCGTHTCARHM